MSSGNRQVEVDDVMRLSNALESTLRCTRTLMIPCIAVNKGAAEKVSRASSPTRQAGFSNLSERRFRETSLSGTTSLFPPSRLDPLEG